MAYVYLHTRLDKNEPFYVGIGSDEYRYGGKYARSKHKIQRSRYWKSIVSKTDYKIDILFDNLSWKEACKKEIELIKFYGRSDLGLGPLCNLTDGGDGNLGNLHSKEQFKKLRKKIVQCKMDGEIVKIWEYARQVSEIGYSHAGVVKCCKGKRDTAYGFRWHYLGENLKPYIPISEKPKRKFKNPSKLGKKIVQKTAKGECIKMWNSFAEAERETGLLACNISVGCSRGGTIYGYKWEYFDENKEYVILENIPYKEKLNFRKK